MVKDHLPTASSASLSAAAWPWSLLESLLKVPYHLSRGWLRIDPAFASLRGNPRFERLIAPSP